jgi:hypothetical protein
MTRAGGGASEQPLSPAHLRRVASQARRLMAEMIFEADRDCLRKMAEELEELASIREAEQNNRTPG